MKISGGKVKTERIPKFIIYSPDFDEDSGGCIALHKLCFVLNQLGYSAILWRWKLKPTTKFMRIFNRRPKIRLSQQFLVDIADGTELDDDCIVVYPEVVSGNPLKHSKVIRWLLHKPGFHTGVANFGKDELVFFFSDYCVEPGCGIHPDNKLFVLSISPCYSAEGTGQRSGSCYMMRKGKGRPIVHDLSDSVQIDGLSHQETAAIFRKSKVFYSYDELTLYSQYAALCGCISVVIPDKFKTRQEWVAKAPISKYGIAYGLDDIEHSQMTLHKVAEYFDELESDSRKTVARFAEVACKHFFR